MKKNATSEKLPPSEPALLQHYLRAKWQLNEWLQAKNSVIVSLDPLDYGWKLENNSLDFNYFEGDTALDMLQKYFCSCSGKCSTKNCNCLSSDILCCAVCSCSDNCQNVEPENDEIQLSNSEVDNDENVYE